MRYEKYAADVTKITLAALAGVGLGAAAMYWLDPESGRRRRAAARDKAVGAATSTVEALQSKARELRSRATGAAAGTKHAVTDAAATLQEQRRDFASE